MSRIFGVIGLGNLGFYVAKTLAESGAEVIAIDKDEEKVKNISNFITKAFIGDATDEEVLEEAGIFDTDTVIVSVGNNIEASVLITVILLNKGIENIIVKAVNSLHEEVLKRLGVKRIIFPERDTGIRLARYLLTGVIQDIPFAKDFSIFEIKAPEKFTGKTLRELDLRNRFGINVLVIKKEKDLIVNPKADERIESGDTLLILANHESLRKFLHG